MVHFDQQQQRCPQFTPADVKRLVQARYGFVAEVKALPSYIDQNFRLREQKDGAQYVLKIANADEEWLHLDLQNQMMQHLALKDRHFPAPRLCPTSSGEEIITVEHQGKRHYVRLLTYLPGEMLVRLPYHSPDLLRQLGDLLGRLTSHLQDFSHPGGERVILWDLRRAGQVIREFLPYVKAPSRRALIEHFLSQYECEVAPRLPSLRTSILYNDANDYNLLARQNRFAQYEMAGLIDFNDALRSCTIFELAIAVAYVMLRKEKPLMAAAHVVRAYHEQFPLTEDEIAVLYPLACIRLCKNITAALRQQALEPDNPYPGTRMQYSFRLLERLREVEPDVAHAFLRHACHLEPHPSHQALVAWLREHQKEIYPVVNIELSPESLTVFDLSAASRLFNQVDWQDQAAVARALAHQMEAEGTQIGMARYNEARLMAPQPSLSPPEQHTVHLGLDIFLPVGTAIYAPLDGVVRLLKKDALLLEHQVSEGLSFCTFYRHLEPLALTVGQSIRKGQQLGIIGSQTDNISLPHLHLQLYCGLPTNVEPLPEMASPHERAIWLSLCPDPTLLLAIPSSLLQDDELNVGQIVSKRQQHFGRSQKFYYNRPINLVRGRGAYFYDEDGLRYLDMVNNVTHVGHCHPRVVDAVYQQMARLNTNSRFIYQGIVRYVERLLATLPEPLSVCFLVCTGSEANDLALRMARHYTGQKDMIVIDGAYHGNTTAVTEISPNRFDGPGGTGAMAYIHKAQQPNGYRGPYSYDEPQAGIHYAADVQRIIAGLQAEGKGFAAFIGESLMGTAGCLPLPAHYLMTVYQHVRAAGALCIADEVQIGFGRCGEHFWGFEMQGVVPDIVTMGKPIGNGHPMAAVITTREIAAAFDNGMKYFNTFGGNPVSCAAGMAVLDVLEEENLQQHALEVGGYLLRQLEALQEKHPLIGHLRGRGLYIGIEFVRHRETKEAAKEEAYYISERMKDNGVIIYPTGQHDNVLKIKPPMIFSQADADLFVHTLDKVLSEGW